MYHVIGGDGNEYGPINAETVRQWLKEGRLGFQSQVRSQDSADWKPLADFQELRIAPDVLCAPQASASGSSPASASSVSGLAIASLVLGAVGCLGLTALAGVICGVLALGRIKRSGGELRGKGIAIGGIALSAFMLLMTGVMSVAMFATFSNATQAVVNAKSKAQSIQCVNNLKQIGLALRIYAADNNDTYPSNILVMSNELNTPYILVCPADTAHPRPAAGWAGLTTNQITYQFLAPGAAESNVVNRVVVRCPIHGNVCLGDGSVRQRNLPSSTPSNPGK